MSQIEPKIVQNPPWVIAYTRGKITHNIIKMKAIIAVYPIYERKSSEKWLIQE